MASKTDYYQVLGVNKSASADEIKKAYRNQALKWHPDRNKDRKEEAEKRFKEINEAYQVLSDSKKKSMYDQVGHDAFSQGGFSRQGGMGNNYGPFSYTYSTSTGGNPFSGSAQGFDFGDPFEIFEQFFGGNLRREARLPRYSISIDFMDAVKGVTKEVSIDGKKRKIKIPAGVSSGTRINFEDFILIVEVRPHKTFEREGNDVYVTVSIPFSLSVLGGEIGVPTVDGDVKIKVRAGTQGNTMMRLRGVGIKSVRGSARGDQYIRIIVETPARLTREQKKLVEELRKEGM